MSNRQGEASYPLPQDRPGIRLSDLRAVRRALAKVARMFWIGEISADDAKLMAYLLTQISGMDAKLYDQRFGQDVEEIQTLLEQLRAQGSETGVPGMRVVGKG